MSTEPRRLRLGDDTLAAGVASLQQAQPSEERMAALAARLAQAGAPVLDGPTAAGPVSGTHAPVPAQPSSLRPIRMAKVFGPGTLVVLAALVVGGGLIATAMLIREADTPLLPAVPPPLATAARAPVGPLTSPSQAPAPAPPGAAVARGSDSGDAPAQQPASAERASAVPADDSVAPSPARGSAASLAPTPPSEPAARNDVRPVAPPARAKTPTAEPGSEGAPLAASTVVESEIDLLKQARSALSADPLQAFALSERCRAQYPSGAFAQEREYIAISALVRLGRESEARSRASLFRMHYPNSAYLPRLTRMLGE